MSKDKILAELRKAYVLEQRTRDPELNQIIQPRTGNIAVKAELTYCKMELTRLLRVLSKAPPENRFGFLRQLIKIIFQASKVQAMTHDEELSGLLENAETHLT
jgi:hypothetical protein